MAKKSMVLRGLTALLTFVFSLSIVTGVTLEGYKSTIDTNLGTQSEKFVSESTDADPLYNKFTPSAEVLNEDGTGNSHALIQKAINLNRQQAAEGAVLLKNEDSILPLKDETVAFIGEFAAAPRFQGAGSSHVNVPCLLYTSPSPRDS